MDLASAGVDTLEQREMKGWSKNMKRCLIHLSTMCLIGVAAATFGYAQSEFDVHSNGAAKTPDVTKTKKDAGTGKTIKLPDPYDKKLNPKGDRDVANGIKKNNDRFVRNSQKK